MSERNRTRRRPVAPEENMARQQAAVRQPGPEGMRIPMQAGMPMQGGGMMPPMAQPQPAMNGRMGMPMQGGGMMPPEMNRGMMQANQPDLQEMPFAVTDSPVPPPPVGDEHAYRSAEEADAFRLGEQMGTESLAKQTGTIQRQQTVTVDRLIEAEKLLMEYKKGKASVERRIIAAQQWWKMRNWEQIQNQRGTKGATEIKSATGWLWNCIIGKHAEALDAFPEPVVLPRMEEDKDEAEILSDILPVILNINGFEDEYSKEQWQKFQEGTGAYYVGWDKTKLGGLGDISIRNISLLNLFWEPGVEDIQESENLFYVQLVNTKRLEEQYPQLKGKLTNEYLKPAEYRKDDQTGTDGKSVLVDWYYHTWDGDRKILQYCQFVGHEILYSTEQSGEAEGLYADGDYPFVLDPLYPVHGSPAGYGLIDICKDAQTDIDTINQAMVQNAVVTSTPRFFVMSDGAINEDEFADWSKPFVHVNGGLGENSIRAVQVNGIEGNALNMLERKIDEMKFVTGNSDIATGAAPSGVTAASAIAALQEAHGRSSKDSTKSSYRATNRIYSMTLERVRQFYDMPRQFRILGPHGQQRFITYTNAKLQEQQMMGGMGLPAGYRKPVFDIEVRSERETSYTRMSQNELAVQFLQLGVFNPQMTDQSLMMLNMMDFRGKDELMNKVEQQGTLQQALMQVGQIALALSQKYDPAVAEQLAPVLSSIGMDAGAMPQAGGVNPKEIANPEGKTNAAESGTLTKARERSNESIRPD